MLKDDYAIDNLSYPCSQSEGSYSESFNSGHNFPSNFPFELRGDEEISKLIEYIQALKEDKVELVNEFCNQFLNENSKIIN